MDTGAWPATVHAVALSYDSKRTGLNIILLLPVSGTYLMK